MFWVGAVREPPLLFRTGITSEKQKQWTLACARVTLIGCIGTDSLSYPVIWTRRCLVPTIVIKIPVTYLAQLSLKF